MHQKNIFIYFLFKIVSQSSIKKIVTLVLMCANFLFIFFARVILEKTEAKA